MILSSAHLNASGYESSITKFIDTLFGSHLTNELVKQLAGPINEGGLGIKSNVRTLNVEQYSRSLTFCAPAIGQILNETSDPSSMLSLNP